MSATHLNPAVSNTAARYVAKAMTKVNPAQQRELLDEMEVHIAAARATLDGGRAPVPGFVADARNLLGLELAGVA